MRCPAALLKRALSPLRVQAEIDRLRYAAHTIELLCTNDVRTGALAAHLASCLGGGTKLHAPQKELCFTPSQHDLHDHSIRIHRQLLPPGIYIVRCRAFKEELCASAKNLENKLLDQVCVGGVGVMWVWVWVRVCACVVLRVCV